MKQNVLSAAEVLDGYDAVSQLYPHIPPMSIWRAWEYAAYLRYQISEPVLDVGCGDGRYFRLIWPQIKEVIGIDMNPEVVSAAQQLGIYRETHVAPAHQLPFPAEHFASAFANCSLEHMDHLPEVLENVRRSLSPGGLFLASVVTDRFLGWASLPLMMNQMCQPDLAKALQSDYEAFHHLTSPFPSEVWVERLERAGFEVLEHIPIMPEVTSRLFLFIDHLWHVKTASGEMGDQIYPYLTSLSNFPKACREVLQGILQMEQDWSVGSGAVFLARRDR